MGSGKFTPERLALIDPLGELQRRAHELWTQAGSPSDKTWEDFWEQAEERMLSAGSPPQSQIVPAVPKPVAHDLSADFQSMIAQQNDILLSVCASAFRAYLDEHEAVCLGHFLRYHIIHLKDERTIAATSVGEAAQLLSRLAKEYSSDFLNAAHAKEFLHVPPEQKKQYWSQILRRVRDADAPLTYADQNTMGRLKELLLKEPRVQAITGLDGR